MSGFKAIRPGETLLMTEEWSDDPRWVDGETISSSGWTVGPTGPDLADSDTDGTLSSVLISGAVFGKQYALTNIVTTSGGKHLARSSQLRGLSGPASFLTFSFTDVDDAARSTVTASDTLTSAFDDGSAISVVNGEYSINGGSYTAVSGTIDNGDTFRVRGTSSASYDTTVSIVLTIGTVSDTFAITTIADPASGDTTPDAFSFTDAAGVELSTVTTSAGATISGLTAAAVITVTGGTYSIDGGSYTSSAGTITNGQTVTARGTSSGSYSTAVNVAVTIGGVSDTFTITTKADPGSGYTPSLDFSDARNSQYIALLEDI